MSIDYQNSLQMIESQLNRLEKISSAFSWILTDMMENYNFPYDTQNTISFLNHELQSTTSELFELWDEVNSTLCKQKNNDKKPHYDFKALEEVQKNWLNDYYSEN